MIWYTDMTDTTNSVRTRRHSVYQNSKNNILNSLRSKIKNADSGYGSDAFDPMNPGCVIQREQILLNKKVKNIRRVYMVTGKYKVGWVVDSDINICMICFNGFGWFNMKHHCRACGLLVCSTCSPFTTKIPALEEENGSRVCKNCFGLKPGLVSTSPLSSGLNTPNSPSPYDMNSQFGAMSANNAAPVAVGSGSRATRNSVGSSVLTTPPPGNYENNNLAQTSRRRPNSSRLPNSASDQALLASLSNQEEQLSQLEKTMEYKYEEAYKIMRQIIPLDIFKCTFETLTRTYGLPEPVASRIWANKILWLVVMHPDDIAKIHLADFRTKYSPVGLDILEMRAIWFNLPHWSGTTSQSPLLRQQMQVQQAGQEGGGGGMVNSLEQGKFEWKLGFKARLDDMAYREARGDLSENLLRNSAYDGYEDLYLFDYEIPLKRRFENSAGYSDNSSNSNSQRQSFEGEPGHSAQQALIQQGRLSHQVRKQNYEDAAAHGSRSRNLNSSNNRHNQSYHDRDGLRDIAEDAFGSGRPYDSNAEDDDENDDDDAVDVQSRQYGSVYGYFEGNDDDDDGDGGDDNDNMSYRSGLSRQPRPLLSTRSNNNITTTNNNFSSGAQVRSTPPARRTGNSRNSYPLTSAPNNSNNNKLDVSSYDPLDDIYNNKGGASVSVSNNSNRNTPVPSVSGGSVNGGNSSNMSSRQQSQQLQQKKKTLQRQSTGSMNSSNNNSSNSNSFNRNPAPTVTAATTSSYHKPKLSIGIANSNFVLPAAAAAEEEQEEDLLEEDYLSAGGEFVEDYVEDGDDDDGDDGFVNEQRESYGYGGASGSSITDSIQSNSLTASLARQVAEQQAQLEAQNLLQQQQLAQIQLLHQQQLQMQQSHALNLNTSRVLNKFYQSQSQTQGSATASPNQTLQKQMSMPSMSVSYTPPPQQQHLLQHQHSFHSTGGVGGASGGVASSLNTGGMMYGMHGMPAPAMFSPPGTALTPTSQFGPGGAQQQQSGLPYGSYHNSQAPSPMNVHGMSGSPQGVAQPTASVPVPVRAPQGGVASALSVEPYDDNNEDVSHAAENNNNGVDSGSGDGSGSTSPHRSSVDDNNSLTYSGMQPSSAAPATSPAEEEAEEAQQQSVAATAADSRGGHRQVNSLQRSSGVFFPDPALAPAQPLDTPFSGTGDVTPTRRAESRQSGDGYHPPSLVQVLSPRRQQQQQSQAQAQAQGQSQRESPANRSSSLAQSPRSVLSDGDTTASSSRPHNMTMTVDTKSGAVAGPMSSESEYVFPTNSEDRGDDALVLGSDNNKVEEEEHGEEEEGHVSPPQTRVPFASTQPTQALQQQQQQPQQQIPSGSVSGGSVSGHSTRSTPTRRKLVHSSSTANITATAAGATVRPQLSPCSVPPAAAMQFPQISPKNQNIPQQPQQQPQQRQQQQTIQKQSQQQQKPKKTPQQQQQQQQQPKAQFNRAEVFNSLFAAIQTGDVDEANRCLAISAENQLGIQIGRDEASDLLLKCFEPTNVLKLQQPRELVSLLIDKCHADINTADNATGETALHMVVSGAIGNNNNRQTTVLRQIASTLIECGADIFIEDNASNSVLSLALTNRVEWILDEFSSTGRESALLNSGNHLLVFKYATTLILSGYSKRASTVIEQGQVQISPEDATELLSSCSGNFDAMKEPIETFELLESLGAKL